MKNFNLLIICVLVAIFINATNTLMINGFIKFMNYPG
jgi:hypothetical protein